MSNLRKAALCATVTALIEGGGASAQTIELEEAIVTSPILDTRVNRTGATVEIVERDEIAEGGLGVQDTLALRPGVSVVANGGTGAESTLSVRGLGETYVGVTFEGIEVTDPAAPTNAFAFGQLTRAVAGRVEVAKGTQTAAYGSDAIAGAVNITGWRPDRDGRSGETVIEAGSHRSISGALHLGHRDESTELALTVARSVSDGFASNVANDEPDGFRQTALVFSGERALGERVRVGVAAFRFDDKVEYDAFGSETGLSDGRRTGLRLMAGWVGDRIDQELSLSRFRVKRDEISDFGPFPFKGERRKVEYVARTAIGADTRLALGADWTREISDVGGVVDSGTNGGIFAEIDHALSPATDIALSLRHDVYSGLEDRTTGRLALVHRRPGDLTFKATFGTGYRAPSLQERFGFGGDPDFLPEDSIGGDLGIEKRWSDGVVSATLFQTEVDNLIRYDNVAFALYQTPGTTVARGVELATAWQVGPVDLFANYTYTDARTEGERLVRVPRHDLSLGVETPLASRLTGRVELRHVGDLLDVDTSTDSSVRLEDYTVADLTLAWQVTQDTETWLRIENVTDRDYQTTLGYDAPGRTFHVGLRARF